MDEKLLKSWPYAALLFLFAQAPAFAARLTIEWETIPGAARYELEVFRSGSQVARPLIAGAKTKWIAELPTGIYTYRLRALSDDQQPGKWSPILSLALGPQGAEPVSPVKGQKVEGKIVLTWNAVPDAQRYRVEVYRGEANVLSKVIAQTSVVFEAASPGAYTWRVASIAEAQDADGKRRWLSGEPGASAEFEVDDTTSSGERTSVEVGLSAATVPYRYADSRPVAPEIGASVEVGLAKDWSACFSLRVLDAKFDFFEVPRYNASVAARHVFGGESWIWGIEAGARLISFFGTAGDGQHLGERFSGLGPGVALDLTHPLFQAFSFGLRADYAVPLTLLGASPGVEISTQLGGNYSFRFGGLARLSPTWRLGASVGVEQTAARYLGPGSGTQVSLIGFPITFALFHSF